LRAEGQCDALVCHSVARVVVVVSQRDALFGVMVCIQMRVLPYVRVFKRFPGPSVSCRRPGSFILMLFYGRGLEEAMYGTYCTYSGAMYYVQSFELWYLGLFYFLCSTRTGLDRAFRRSMKADNVHIDQIWVVP
jgi:hypothetical protein